jgi:hypothetical protein
MNPPGWQIDLPDWQMHPPGWQINPPDWQMHPPGWQINRPGWQMHPLAWQTNPPDWQMRLPPCAMSHHDVRWLGGKGRPPRRELVAVTGVEPVT